MAETFSERVYRWLLVLYPREHQREYGELMVQLFRDRMRCDGKGFAGLIVWIQMILDLFGAVAKEHSEGVDMKRRTRFGIALAVVVVAGGIGATVLLANTDGEPSISLSWQQADAVAEGEPRVSVSRQQAGGIAASAPWTGSNGEPEISLSWQEAGAVADGEPNVSLSWSEAGAITGGEPRVSVSWHEAETVADGEPRVSVSRQLAGGLGASTPLVHSDGEPPVSLSWQKTDAIADGEPKVSLSWAKADQVAPE